MNASPKKRLSAAERRETILTAAADCFAAAGYEGVSMDDLARAAGISKPVLYDHFPSKIAVFSAVLNRVRERLLAAGTNASTADESDEERVHAAVFAFFAFVENHSIEMRVLLNVPAGSPEALTASLAVQEVASAGISRLLAQLTVAGQISDLDAAAEYIKAGLHALARQLMQTRARPQELAELAAQLVWSGLRGRS